MKVGDHVKALRSHNKAVELTGTIERIEGSSVTMVLDDNPNWLETVHLDDVTVLEAKVLKAKKSKEE
jgi:hypothetical protein